MIRQINKYLPRKSLEPINATYRFEAFIALAHILTCYMIITEAYHSVHSEGDENISPDAARTAVFPLLAQSFHLELAATYRHFRPRDNHATYSTEGPSNLLTGYL